MEYDVVVIGASISGCAAAIHMARAGVRVALVEKHRSIETPKRLCGHFLLGGAQGPLQRLGVWDDLIALGAGTGGLALWCEQGLLDRTHPDCVPPFLNVRRSTLDPHLRRIAAETNGVDLLLGYALTGLLHEHDRVAGVRLRHADGDTLDLRAGLVVGADGYRSKTAELADAAERTYANSRVFLYAYYRDVPPRVDGEAAVWWYGNDWAVLSPTDGGLTEVALMPVRADMPSTTSTGLSAYLEDYFGRLPSGPDLQVAQRASKVIASLDYPLVRRDPVPTAGVALIGDAALTADPAPAPGCTWALLSAQWLAERATAPLLAGRPTDKALRGYRRDRRRLDREFFLMRSDAATGTTNPAQHLLRRAAVHDPVTSERIMRVGMQVAPTTTLLRPTVLARAARFQGRARQRAHRHGQGLTPDAAR